MLRKLRPLEKKLSTAFSIKSKKSKHSIKSVQSGCLRQEENQQAPTMIPDEMSTPGPPRSIPDVDCVLDTHEQAGERLQRYAPGQYQSEVSTDSLASRYRRAVNDSDPSTLNAVETVEEDNPLMSATAGSSPSSSETDFDWNETDESELDESERQTRDQQKWRELQARQEHNYTIRHAKRLHRFYRFLMKLSSPVRTLIIGFLGASIAITPAILVWLRFTELSHRNQILAWSIWLSTSFAASCATSIIVEILPSIAIKLFELFYGSKPESLNTQVELWMNVRYWAKLAMGFASYWVALSVMFSHLFRFREDPRLEYFHWVKKGTAGLFTAGAVLLVEKILLQVIQLNFHRTGLKVRLEENKLALWALDRLAAAKGVSHNPKKRNSKSRSNLNSRRMRNGLQMPHTKDSITVDVPLTPKDASMDYSGGKRTADNRTPELELMEKNQKRRRSSNFLIFADQLTSALNSAVKNRNSATGGMLSSTYSAKKLAKKLFEGLDKDRGGFITPDEFEPYFKKSSDAAIAFKLFDQDGNGDIDRKEMRNAVVRIYKERRALSKGLKDMSSAVSKLDAVMISAACLLTIFIWFFIFNPKGTSLQLVPMATMVLGFSFIFGNTAKNLFESMLFIFSIHPYDVGDLVAIDGVHMFVMEFGLFSTTFQRVDGQVVVAPNSVLIARKHILNIRRSGPTWETTNVMVGFNTPLEILHEFRARLRQYVMDNPREWKGGLTIAMEHKSNWQDWGARWDRRTFLMKEMKRVMDSLNITYKLPPQPISLLPRRPGPHHLSSSRQGSSMRSHHPTGGGVLSLSPSRGAAAGAGHSSHPFQNGYSLSSLQ
ncbi:uncharacterized protein PGTG_20691 [Puccinia graminis f. sp. tritici CRL 75-36-700-3]|uniref:EF-hand domain-containing protein n=1 Tax=Puccinia graminis f. sp. tritici (strain CRL 75-36-700-3 / race SCCL) TaxID=418459 RepID=H6QPE6_PUCGT|nr:uncharacterized protein PGTG_20691 [Puccinia graminis f. sp. tritici CRL 75-36-700-3]EHS63597.1 hypothetical protein PGTG_20691 [Puccinia graminis f. sp. tritici CRL 75-36-700-3]